MKAVGGLSVTVLVDNYTDLLLPSEGPVKRAPIFEGSSFRKAPLAEHGLSLLIEADGYAAIMDFGLSSVALFYNVEAFGLDLGGVKEGVLSHGHFDHFGSLEEFAERFEDFKLFVHEKAALKNRFFQFPTGERVYFPEPPLEKINTVPVKEPKEILGGRLLVSGTIPRVTDFEKGLPGAFYEEGGEVKRDPIEDDMAVYAVVEGKGLVVVSGCAHAGIVNTIKYGMELTGERLYAVLGGFHLTGPGMEEVVPRTIEELKRLSPRLIAPMHCTGWFSQVKLMEAFPEAFVLSSPGTRVEL